MGIDYKHKSDILAEMELVKYLVEQREVTVTDSKGNPVRNALRQLRNKEITKKGLNSAITAQLEDWFKNVVYGRSSADIGEFTIAGLDIDTSKFLDTINRYSALNLLGLNFLQGTANWGLGQVMQIIESFSGEYFTMKDYANAGIEYKKNFPGILADIGSRNPINKVNKLIEFFDILNDYGEDNRFRKSSRFRQMMQSNTLFFTSHAGEHMMQARAMIAMLRNKKLIDKEGNIIKDEKGKEINYYDILKQKKKKTKNILGQEKEMAAGEIIIDPKYKDYITVDEILNYGRKMKRILSRMHGEYSKLGENALQRYALGRMAMMFRKFIAPGFKRRWETGYDDKTGTKLKYNEISESFTEGAYVSTYRFIKNLVRDLYKYKFDLAVASRNYSELTDVERANFKRTMTEVSFLIGAWIVGYSMINLMSERKDDDDWWLEFMAFQALRLRSELMFFANPVETMRLLRSPAAAMSLLENSIDMFNLLLNPFDETGAFQLYERGPREGQYKITKPIQNLVPVYKQIPRLKDMQGTLNWFRG